MIILVQIVVYNGLLSYVENGQKSFLKLINLRVQMIILKETRVEKTDSDLKALMSDFQPAIWYKCITCIQDD